MDLELDLTSLGLRPASERTLGALKRSAAAAATATRPALGAQSSGPARAAATLVPPSPQLAAGLDALAGLGSPVRPPKPPPAGATHTRNVSVDDLLGDLLSPPPPPARRVLPAASRSVRRVARGARSADRLTRRKRRSARCPLSASLAPACRSRRTPARRVAPS
jgi:hypothetical protein